MKIIALKSCFIIALFFLASCGAQKGGCGLTSDAKKIEAQTSIQYEEIVTSE